MTTDQTIQFIQDTMRRISQCQYHEIARTTAAYCRGLITMASLQGIVEYKDCDALMLETQTVLDITLESL
ncbi:hypothetical protein D3C84_103920 [compost metagenome]